MNVKLHKSNKDKMISGVCGGIANYLGIDSSLVRIILVLLLFNNGFWLFLYILGALILPDEYESVYDDVNVQSKDPIKILGVGLIIIGSISLLNNFTPLFETKYFFPALLIALGVVIIIKGRKDQSEE